MSIYIIWCVLIVIALQVRGYCWIENRSSEYIALLQISMTIELHFSLTGTSCKKLQYDMHTKNGFFFFFFSI